MNKPTFCRSLLGLLLALLLSACGSTKKMIYLQGLEDLEQNPQQVNEDYEFRIKPDDRIDVIVSSKEPELLEPFSNTLSLGSIGRSGGNNVNERSTTGLLVDKNGVISLPFLGDFQAAGLTRQELADEIRDKLIADEYIKNPSVVVRFRNSRILVLGEVRSPGVKEVSNERISLLEVLGMSGDLLPTAKRKNIMVLREENGVRTRYIVDLTSGKKVFNSPVYYLQQNDIVYVEPNKAINVKGSYGLTYLSAGSAIMGTIASIISLIAVLTR